MHTLDLFVELLSDSGHAGADLFDACSGAV